MGWQERVDFRTALFEDDLEISDSLCVLGRWNFEVIL